MSPAIKTLYAIGLFLLIGMPVILTIATLVQAPAGHTGFGANLTKIIVGNFAALPFMLVGLILVLVAAVRNRHRKS